MEILVGHHNGDAISIQVLGRKYPDSTDYWDANWLAIFLRLRIGAFQTDIPASLRAEELRDFGEGLRRLRGSIQEEVKFTSMEEWLTLNVSHDATGYIVASGKVVDRPGSPNQLSFRIEEIEPSEMIVTINALEKVNAAFPVVGAP